jgi:hypothetical protein
MLVLFSCRSRSYGMVTVVCVQQMCVHARVAVQMWV